MADTDAGPHEEDSRVLRPATSVLVPLSFGGRWGVECPGVRGFGE
jgi:hypothetical protein